VINLAGGIYTALVVLLFAVVKFTEGAWLIVIIFPVLVFTLIRLNREYRAEADCLADPGHGGPRAQPPNYSRRVVLLLVDGYDLATIAALKYARGLRPAVLRAVHFSLDGARADQLRRQWVDAGTGIPLELADCPDRRLAHAAARLATSLAVVPGTHVTVVLPRRCYPPLAGRLLHDHTADRIARVVSRVPGDEIVAKLPGDELLPGAGLVTTRAITIDALPEAIWPWLAQMGSGRGGAYTYDWIENLLGLNMHSASEILPEYRDIKIGDELPLGSGGPVMRVEVLDRRAPSRSAPRTRTGCGSSRYCLTGNRPGCSAGTGSRPRPWHPPAAFSTCSSWNQAAW
jgi:hypothetical protein